MELHYNQWFRAHRKAVRGWTVSEAYQLHTNRQFYCIIIGALEFPQCFLEINDHFLYVGFLDELKREFMNYEYAELEPNKIFLKEIQVWEYDGDTDNRIISIRYRFTPEGRFAKRITGLKTRISDTFELKSTIDVSSNYGVYPDFSNYDKIIKEKIDLKILDNFFR